MYAEHIEAHKDTLRLEDKGNETWFSGPTQFSEEAKERAKNHFAQKQKQIWLKQWNGRWRVSGGSREDRLEYIVVLFGWDQKKVELEAWEQRELEIWDEFASSATVSKSFIVPMLNHFPALHAKALPPAELTLTCKGMSSVNWDYSDSEFEFVFGEDKVCRIQSVLAEFLSPKVARLRRCDISFDVYTFRDSEMFDAFQSLVSMLRSGETVRVNKSTFPVLLRLSQELENDDLLSSLLGLFNIEYLSLDEALLLLLVGMECGTSLSAGLWNLRDFIASHFYKLRRILDDLDLETLQFLLSSPSLQIEDEDSLYDFVRSRSENDLRFTSLFEFVCFEHLSVDRIKNFASFASENLHENINAGIWKQICRRLILEASENPRSPTPRSIKFVHNSVVPGVANTPPRGGKWRHKQGRQDDSDVKTFYKSKRIQHYHRRPSQPPEHPSERRQDLFRRPQRPFSTHF